MSTHAEKLANFGKPSLLPTPTRGRNKSRRSRYATGYPRGRGVAPPAAATWTPPVAGRRGRTTARRSRMY